MPCPNLSDQTTDSWGLHSKMRRELVVGLSIFGLGQIGLGHTHLGGAGLPWPRLPHPGLMTVFSRFALSLACFQRVFKWFSTFCPMMAFFTAIKATSPLVCLICHSYYGDVITFIVHLTRIELGDLGQVKLFLLRFWEMHLCVGLWHMLMSYRTLGLFLSIMVCDSCYDCLDYEASA